MGLETVSTDGLMETETQRLREVRQLTEESARWSVESWALALGIISEEQLSTERLPAAIWIVEPPSVALPLVSSEADLMADLLATLNKPDQPAVPIPVVWSEKRRRTKAWSLMLGLILVISLVGGRVVSNRLAQMKWETTGSTVQPGAIKAALPVSQTTQPITSAHLADIAERIAKQVEIAPLNAFQNRAGRAVTERDRVDVVASLRDTANNVQPKHLAHRLFRIFSEGAVYPACQNGKGIDFDCLDTDRWVRISPEYATAHQLAEYLASSFASTSSLGALYENGWGVEKDLLRAWDLYRLDPDADGRVNANRLVQRLLSTLGASIAEDGDFGRLSCQALLKHLPSSDCARIDRATVEKLIGDISAH